MGNELINRTIEIENEVYRIKQRLGLLEDLTRVMEQQFTDMFDDIELLKTKSRIKKK